MKYKKGYTQQISASSNSTIETLEQSGQYLQLTIKDTVMQII